MQKDELDFYKDLTPFQKEVVAELKKLGFEHKYFTTYHLLGWGEIKVNLFDNWADLLKYVHNQGKDQKRYEILRALGS